MSDLSQLWEGLRKAQAVAVLNREVEGVAGEVGVGLGNRDTEPGVVLNATDDVAVGVVDRHGGFNRGENDGVGWSVVFDERRERLELGLLEGNMGLHDVHGERVEYESRKQEQGDAEERLLVAGVEDGPEPIENKAAGECHERREEHEHEGMDGYIVAHERIPEQAGKQEATKKIDGWGMAALAGLIAEREEDRYSKKRQSAEVLEEKMDGVRITSN